MKTQLMTAGKAAPPQLLWVAMFSSSLKTSDVCVQKKVHAGGQCTTLHIWWINVFSALVRSSPNQSVKRGGRDFRMVAVKPRHQVRHRKSGEKNE